MSAEVDESDQVEIGSELEDGVWSVSISLGQTTILVETNTEDIDSLPILVDAMSQILEAAWAAIEQAIQEDHRDQP